MEKERHEMVPFLLSWNQSCHDMVMRALPYSIWIVSTVLLINVFVGYSNTPEWLVLVMLMAAPLLMVWMVLHVLQDQKADIRDLEADEDWGYQDRPDLRPLKH